MGHIVLGLASRGWGSLPTHSFTSGWQPGWPKSKENQKPWPGRSFISFGTCWIAAKQKSPTRWFRSHEQRSTRLAQHRQLLTSMPSSRRWRVKEGVSTRGGDTATIATSVLKLAPNAWLDCSILRSQVSIAVSQCRMLDALELIRSLRTVAERYSLTREVVENEANLGTSNSVAASTRAGMRRSVESMRQPSTSMRATAGRVESLARVSLATNELALCRTYLDRIDAEALTDANLLHTTAVRWARLVRARLLLKERDAVSAVDELRSTNPETSRIIRRSVFSGCSSHTGTSPQQTVGDVYCCDTSSEGRKQRRNSRSKTSKDGTALRRDPL